MKNKNTGENRRLYELRRTRERVYRLCRQLTAKLSQATKKARAVEELIAKEEKQ